MIALTVTAVVAVLVAVERLMCAAPDEFELWPGGADEPLEDALRSRARV